MGRTGVALPSASCARPDRTRHRQAKHPRRPLFPILPDARRSNTMHEDGSKRAIALWGSLRRQLMTRSPTSDTKAALLVVDLQRGMFNGERLPPIHAGEALLARVEALIAQARGAGIPVVFVRHGGGPGHLLESGTANWQIYPAIAPAAGEAIVEKHTPDSFTKRRCPPRSQRLAQGGSSSWARRAKSASTPHAGGLSRLDSRSSSSPMPIAPGTMRS